MNTSANDLVNKKKKIKSLLSNKQRSLFEPNLVPRSFPVMKSTFGRALTLLSEKLS